MSAVLPNPSMPSMRPTAPLQGVFTGRHWSALVGATLLIAVLDTGTGETLMDLEGHTGGVKSIDLSPDGRYALSGSDDRTLRLWDLSTGEQLALLIGHTYDVTGVAFSPDDLTAYTTSRDGTWRVWDLRDYIGS